MLRHSNSQLFAGLLSAMLIASSASMRGQVADSTHGKKQLAADERAFRVARANVDPDQRLAAMRGFLKAYPKSNRTSRAENDIMKILIDEYPRQSAELKAQIALKLKQAKGTQSQAAAKEEIAFMLAEAGAAGIELPQAETLAKDAVAHLNEAEFDKETLATYAEYKEPEPKSDELHKRFASNRAEALAVLADVYLREGKQAAASPLISEAYTLDSKIDDVNTQRGRLALLNHDDALALESFENAQLLGTLKASDREAMMQLYRKSHSGNDAGLPAEMDARYSQLYPPPFKPGKAKEVPGGRTVLLELFTGSACPPCVGADAAVDGLLQAYPRSEFVALAFDQHIPEPDPLTNPDSAARADFYEVEHTPNFVIDGDLKPFYGGDLHESKVLYDKLAALVDTEASRQDGVNLKVSANRANGLISAHAVVTLPSIAEIEKERTAAPSSSATSGGETDNAPTPNATAQLPPSVIVNFALVEDDIRYSGENGVRFHRMVVRSLAKPANAGFSVSSGATASLDASFEPATISRALVSYLDNYEEKNEKFGKIKFISKDMTMRPENLLIAVWVQDAVSRRVLQAAIVPISGASHTSAE